MSYTNVTVVFTTYSINLKLAVLAGKSIFTILIHHPQACTQIIITSGTIAVHHDHDMQFICSAVSQLQYREGFDTCISIITAKEYAQLLCQSE